VGVRGESCAATFEVLSQIFVNFLFDPRDSTQEQPDGQGWGGVRTCQKKLYIVFSKIKTPYIVVVQYAKTPRQLIFHRNRMLEHTAAPEKGGTND
jgi:hypothetical protein